MEVLTVLNITGKKENNQMKKLLHQLRGWSPRKLVRKFDRPEEYRLRQTQKRTGHEEVAVQMSPL